MHLHSEAMSLSAHVSSHTTMPPPPLPSPARRSSTGTEALKRLSLSFPTQGRDHSRQRPSSLLSQSPGNTSPETSPERRAIALSESNAFLTALAAQERRVLELKEELQKAEVDLERLKRQWAVHEATKKRNEMRHVEQLRPLTSPTRDVMMVDAGAQGRVSMEEDRRKAMYVRTKQPQRKVFEGGRHTRTLSLLSPPSLGNARATTGLDSSLSICSEDDKRRLPTRSATFSQSKATIKPQSSKVLQHSKGTKEDLVNTGKQLVGDLREGLWTFIEDLRQATVGEEAVSGLRQDHTRNSPLGRSPARNGSRSRAKGTPTRAPTRRRPDLEYPSTTMSRSDRALVDVDNSASSNQTSSVVPATEEESSKLTKGSLNTTLIVDDDEGWDNWDSPAPKVASPTASTCTANSLRVASPSPVGSSPRTSTSSFETTPRPPKERQKSHLEQLPWPALTKLSPGNLTRTASTLMREWEASLVEPSVAAEEEGTGIGKEKGGKVE